MHHLRPAPGSKKERTRVGRGEGSKGKTAGRGVMTIAVGLVSDYLLHVVGLHRVEINIRPENAPSCKVAEKAGYLLEGTRARYLHIDGQWRDHVSYVKETPTVE